MKNLYRNAENKRSDYQWEPGKWDVFNNNLVSTQISYISQITFFCNINIWNERMYMMVLDKIKSFGHLKKLIYKHVKFYKKSSKLHVWIYTCNKRDIVGIKWPIFLGNSHRTFSQFVIYTGPPKDLISVIILMFSVGNKVQTEKYLVASYTCG